MQRMRFLASHDYEWLVALTSSLLMNQVSSAAGLLLYEVQLTLTRSPTSYRDLPPVMTGPSSGNTAGEGRKLLKYHRDTRRKRWMRADRKPMQRKRRIWKNCWDKRRKIKRMERQKCFEIEETWPKLPRQAVMLQGRLGNNISIVPRTVKKFPSRRP